MKKINKVRDISLKNTRQPGDKYRVERKISAESINTGHVSGLKDKEEIVLRCRYDIPKKKITMFIQMTDFITRFTCSGKFNPLEAKFTHKTYYWFNNTQTKK